MGTAVVLAASLGVFWVSTQVISLPPAWRTFEFCQYAEIGRNLATERSYDTRLVEPMALAVIDRDGACSGERRWPVVNRYPLPCLMIAGLMRWFGPSDAAAAWSNGLAITLLGLLAFTCARHWYGSRWAAVVALLFVANPSFYGEFILLGTPDVWFAALFLAQLLVWSAFEPGRTGPARLGWAFSLGILSGLAYLARFNATMFVAVQLAALLRWRRWRETLVVALTMASFVAPMAAYNWRHFHRLSVSVYSTWNLLDEVGVYRVEPWLYYQTPNLVAELATHGEGLARKFATNLFQVVPVRIWGLWRLDLLLPLALLGLASRRVADERERRFAVWSVGFFVLQLTVFSAMRLELEDRNSPHHGRYFFWFATPVLLLSVGLLRRLSTRIPRLVWPAGLIIALQLAGFAWSWSEMVPRHRSRTNLGQDPIREVLRRVVAENQTIASNQPQITAWFCGLRSISLPANPAELARLNHESPTTADYVFIDMNYNCIDLDPQWGLLTVGDPRAASAWEPELLRDYEYVFPARMTRPLQYVLLRRQSVSPSDWERDFKRGLQSQSGS